MEKCIALASIAAAMNCIDTDNRAGIVDCVLMGYADEVGTWPTLPAPSGDEPLTMEAAGAWDGDLAMKNGRSMYELHFTDESGELKITEQGEKGGKSYLYELDLSRAKMDARMFGLENAVKDRKLVILVRDRNGVWYLMGDKYVPAMNVPGDGSTTGKAGTDQNRTTLKFQYSCQRKLIYAGEIDSLLQPTDEYGYDPIGTDDYTDPDRYTTVDIGTQIHNTGNTNEERNFMVENNSSYDDLYAGLSSIVADGKTPVLQAVLQTGLLNISISIPLHKDGDNFVGSDITEGGHYVAVEITPLIATSTIYVSINE